MERDVDPDKLLAEVQEEEHQASRGKLKIYLGAAPGVGKTYAMLQDALRKKKEGLDIIVGFIETHNRPETEVLVQGLEVFPRVIIDYHGKELSELDLDGILKRQPAVVLIDEMAHTNPPGMRHLKRWQDIKELLDRGINVYSTLNVQHIESLNDIIAQITGVIVKETVPDSMLELAHSIALIDLPPEDLLKRLAEGKVYVPAQAEIAIQNFFREGNLIALRELALRITAEQVDTQVFLHRRGKAIKRIWPTVERLLVCIDSDPSSAKLIRATFRMARSLHAEWVALYIEKPSFRPTTQQRESALQNLRLAERLGGETVSLVGKNIGEEITNFARARNVTKLILGKQIRPRWKTLLFGSTVDELVRRSGDIDLYIIQGDPEGIKKAPKENISAPTPKKWRNYVIGLLTVLVCTVINFFLYPYLAISSLMMVYLFGIVFVGLRGDGASSFVASVLSVLAFDFFFIPPHFSFAVSDVKYAITLIIMLIIAQTISYLTTTRQQKDEAARSRELRIATMHILSRRLATARGLNNLLNIAIHYINEVFESQAVFLLPNRQNQLEIFSDQHAQVVLSEKEQSVAQWVYDLGQIAGLGTNTLPDSEAIYLPLLGVRETVGVLRVLPKQVSRLEDPEQLHLLERIASQIALVIEVERPAEPRKNLS